MRSQPGCAGKTREGYNIQQMLEILTAQECTSEIVQNLYPTGAGLAHFLLLMGWKSVLLWNWRKWTLSADKVPHILMFEGASDAPL